MSNEVVLYSGGMDSLIAWYYLGKPQTLYVDLGHIYAKKEMSCIEKLPPKPKIYTDLYGHYFELPNAQIPGRNFLLSMFAAGAGYDKIWMISQKGEQTVPDKTRQFYEDASRMISAFFKRPIVVDTPFWHMYKHDMVKWYLEKGLPVEDLKISISCYSAEEGHCGHCQSCWRKYYSLVANGIKCADWFNSDVVAWGMQNYGNRLENYDEERQRVMRIALYGEA